MTKLNPILNHKYHPFNNTVLSNKAKYSRKEMVPLCNGCLPVALFCYLTGGVKEKYITSNIDIFFSLDEIQNLTNEKKDSLSYFSIIATNEQGDNKIHLYARDKDVTRNKNIFIKSNSQLQSEKIRLEYIPKEYQNTLTAESDLPNVLDLKNSF